MTQEEIAIREALTIVANRYSEQQLMKAQDIIGDMQDEFRERGRTIEALKCENIFMLLSEALNLSK